MLILRTLLNPSLLSLLALLLPLESGTDPGTGSDPSAESEASAEHEASVHGEAGVVKDDTTGTWTLFHNGRIHINDGQGTVVEALLVNEGRVVALGPSADFLASEDAASWTHVDLKGATALPGLQDAHGRLEDYGEMLVSLDLRGCASFDEVVERCVAHAETLPEKAWLVGWGWNQDTWEKPEFPHHGDLSEAVDDRPVLLKNIDGSVVLVNQKVLELADLDGPLDAAPKVFGGRVLMDEDFQASGVLIDAATEMVTSLMPELTAEERLGRFLAVQDELLARGITAVHDMGMDPSFVQVLETARQKRHLRVRVVAYLDGNGRLTEDMLTGYPVADSHDMLSVIGIMLNADGTLGSRGAALIDDYSDDPGNKGNLLLRKDELARRILLTANAGMQPAVRAAGDRANRLVLDVYEALVAAVPEMGSLRPRVEHALVVSTKDWPRFPELGVIPSMQPIQAVRGANSIAARLGDDRRNYAEFWHSFAPTLRDLAFGSNFPTWDSNPLAGIHAIRVHDAEHGGVDEASLTDNGQETLTPLSGFTSGAAYACHQDERRGRLLPGFGADLTVLDLDPLECELDELAEARVHMTVVNGTILFRNVPN